MKTAVNNYISSLNWGYKVSLRDKNVNYVNAYAEFVEPHKIKVSVLLIQFLDVFNTATKIEWMCVKSQTKPVLLLS